MKIDGREISAKLRWNTILKSANQLLLCYSSTEGVVCILSYMGQNLHAGDQQDITLPYCNE